MGQTQSKHKPPSEDAMTITTYKNEDLDEALWAARPGAVIQLQPERTYYIRGPWQFRNRGHISLPSGCTLVATGATIMLRDAEQTASSGLRVDRDLPILWAGSETRIEGGTWHCNAAGHPGWFTQGIRFFGRFDIGKAIITGMRGTRTPNQTINPVESFAISSEGDTAGSSVVGVRVEDSGGNEPNDYVSGIFVGSTVPWSPGQKISKVTLCDVRLGRYGQFGFACNGMTEFANCHAVASRGFYNDTGDTRAILRNCELHGSYAAVSMVGLKNCTREVGVVGGSLEGERVVEWDEGSTANMLGTVSVSNAACQGKYLAAIACRPGRPTVIFSGCTITGDALHSMTPGSPKAIVLPCE